jgi:hypothetical protein
MALPGFNAEASVYSAFGHYYATSAARGTNAHLALAGTCTCTDPG